MTNLQKGVEEKHYCNEVASDADREGNISRSDNTVSCP